MATRYAIATGNWNNAAIWDGGVSIPTTGDDVFSNGFTVTINQAISVQTLRNSSNVSPAIAAGGGFIATNGNNITLSGATVGGVNTGFVHGNATALLTISSTTSLTITSNIGLSETTNTSSANVLVSGTGTVNFVGNIMGTSTGIVDYGIQVTGNSTVVFTGNIQGAGGGLNRKTFLISSASTTNITGNITGGIASYGVENTSSGTLNIVGNTTASNLSAVLISGTGTTTVTGTNTASSSAAAVTSTSTGLVTINGNMVNTANIMAVFSLRMRISPTISMNWLFQTSGADRALYTADSVLGMPAVTDVRSGVVYGSGTLTGTCAVPPALSVAYGVPVDNTTGLSIITRAQLITDVGAIAAAYTV